MQNEKIREIEAVVLDFLKNGYATDNRPSHMKTPVAQAVGKNNLALLELVPRKDIFLQPHEEVYIGDDKRERIHHVIGKIPFSKLTSTARAELDHVIRQIVDEREKEFIDFFNNSQPLSTRMHSLELLPGLGKKHMWEIVEERRVGPFESYDDLKSRVKLIPDPQKLLVKRIIKELEGNEKHVLFVK
jgi:putative nucleotide binding protein